MKRQTNSIVYKTSKVFNGQNIVVTIRLDDECKNGHQDFAITANVYSAGKPTTDKYWLMGGCCHDEIAAAFPEFIPFIKLHLCDFKGIPMHCSANGFYHLRNGFNDTPITSPNFKDEYCTYYRITPAQFDALNQCKTIVQYSLCLEKTGVFIQWQKEAFTAIEQLEKLTDCEFVIDSARTNYNRPSNEEIEEETRRIATGYYTPEAEKQREAAKLNELIAKLEAQREKNINAINSEYDIKKEVLLKGGKDAYDNCIYYPHLNQLAFNWLSYGMLTEEFVEELKQKLQLPDGVKVVNKKGGK